jgi:hypothetical protein
MPLKSEGRYALCFTWRAPEISRPGAVWAHVLLVPMDLIAESPDPFAVAKLATRPTPKNLKSYRSPLDFSPPQASRVAEEVPQQVLEEVLAAAYLTASDPVVVEQDLDVAESALAAVWGSQWPALRVRFAFRTRDSVRDSKRADVTIARRLRGPSRRQSLGPRSDWVRDLASEMRASSADKPLSTFLREFGPFDDAETASVERLATVFVSIQSGEPREIRDVLAAAYPTRNEGQQLKRLLFGGEVPDERTRQSMLIALLGSGTDGWDAFQLHLPEQIASFIGAAGIEAFARELGSSVGEGIREAACLALAQRHDPSDVAGLSSSHLDLVVEVVRESPDLLEYEAAWVNVGAEIARTLLGAVDSPSTLTLTAALMAGHGDVVIAAVPLATALLAASKTPFGTAKRVVEALSWPAVVEAAATEPRTALLAAATAGRRRMPPGLLTALRTSRAETDELWLRAAVAAIDSAELPTREVLPIVFGPLHEAMTSDRLPHDCWITLDPLLPASPDPAQRLRRHLVTEARREHWSESEFRRAIADAGPFASQLRYDFADHSDEWYVSVAKTVLRAVGILGR